MAKYTDENIENFNSLEINQVPKIDTDENGPIIIDGKRQRVHHCFEAVFKDHQGAGVSGRIKFVAQHDDSDENIEAAARSAIKALDVKDAPIEDADSFTKRRIVII